jgi:hypothetical protein
MKTNFGAKRIDPGFKLIDAGLKRLIRKYLEDELQKGKVNHPGNVTGDVQLTTDKELMVKLNVSSQTLRRRRKKGMPHIQNGKKIYYEFDKVIKWMEGNCYGR